MLNSRRSQRTAGIALWKKRRTPRLFMIGAKLGPRLQQSVRCLQRRERGNHSPSDTRSSMLEQAMQDSWSLTPCRTSSAHRGHLRCWLVSEILSLNSEIGHSFMRSSLGVGSGCDERIQLRRSRDLPTQDAVEQRVCGFQTAPALGEMEHEPATCAAQDGSAGKDLGANRCRFAIRRQIGSALELNQ